MAYLQNCKYEESYDPHVYTFTGPCVFTGEEYSVTIPAQELFQYNQGLRVQDALKSLSADDREFVTNGVSPKGYDLHFNNKYR